MNKDRLLRLADHLDQVVAREPETFDMDTWTDQVERDNGTCGTTCCAFGHACAIPEFRGAGLRMGIGGEPELHTDDGLHVGYLAAEAFFGIGEGEADLLFCPRRYEGVPLPTDVSARIRALVASQP